jgi:membrane protease YdiL (CAAX protease family)
MVDSSIEVGQAGQRDRKVLWVEFAIVSIFVYGVGLALQWLPLGGPSVAVDPPLRLAEELGKLLPILFIVAVADGTVGTIGLKRPVWRMDLVVLVALAAVLYLLARLPVWMFSRIQLFEWAGLFHTNRRPYEFDGLTTFYSVIPATIASCMFQEVFARGYVIGRLRELIGGTWVPLIISTCMFGAWHMYQGPVGLAQTSIMGFVFGLIYIRTGRLWPMIVVHTINNLLFQWLLYNAYSHVILH